MSWEFEGYLVVSRNGNFFKTAWWSQFSVVQTNCFAKGTTI
jgi:hypothetical protein